jgi:transcriptional regulator with XRE-family HTH domain
MERTFMDIGKQLKMLRKSNNKPQREIAEYLKIKVNTYSQYENNKRDPGLFTIGQICKYYNISPTLFFVDFLKDKPLASMSFSELGSHYDLSIEKINSLSLRLIAQKKYSNVENMDLNNAKIDVISYQEFLKSLIYAKEEFSDIVDIIKLKMSYDHDDIDLKMSTILNNK